MYSCLQLFFNYLEAHGGPWALPVPAMSGMIFFEIFFFRSEASGLDLAAD
jgi:hypothetical protein